MPAIVTKRCPARICWAPKKSGTTSGSEPKRKRRRRHDTRSLIHLAEGKISEAGVTLALSILSHLRPERSAGPVNTLDVIVGVIRHTGITLCTSTRADVDEFCSLLLLSSLMGTVSLAHFPEHFIGVHVTPLLEMKAIDSSVYEHFRAFRVRASHHDERVPLRFHPR